MNLNCDWPLSNLALNCNLRLYAWALIKYNEAQSIRKAGRCRLTPG